MRPVVQELLDILQLEQLEQNLFRGKTRATGQRSIFGGLVAGQALMAASRTVPESRAVHSLHAYFLRAGDYNLPIVYEVDRIRDGGSFTTRRVNAIQHGKAIFSLAASFAEDEEGVEHQTDMPDVPKPAELESDNAARLQVAENIPEPFRSAFLQEKPVEFRPVVPRNPFDTSRQPAQRMGWFKITDTLDVDQATHRVLLTFCSDFGLMGTAMMPHGMHFFQPQLQAASLDHAMWFHKPLRCDQWLLYCTDSPRASGSRGINRGLIYAEDGTLVATVAQEGLMRLRPVEMQS